MRTIRIIDLAMPVLLFCIGVLLVGLILSARRAPSCEDRGGRLTLVQTTIEVVTIDGQKLTTLHPLYKCEGAE